MYLDHALLDELADKLSEGVKRLDGVKVEAQSQVRSALEAVFQNMDVVSREQMEVQEALLIKTREKIKILEERIETLEAQLIRSKA
ncbi:MAG: accessory factor UbiK family protein [Mariprofundaceae bacterium]